jgi:hypothetical protein
MQTSCLVRVSHAMFSQSISRHADLMFSQSISRHADLMFSQSISCHADLMFSQSISRHADLMFSQSISRHADLMFSQSISCHADLMFSQSISCHADPMFSQSVSCHADLMFSQSLLDWRRYEGSSLGEWHKASMGITKAAEMSHCTAPTLRCGKHRNLSLDGIPVLTEFRQQVCFSLNLVSLSFLGNSVVFSINSASSIKTYTSLYLG